MGTPLVVVSPWTWGAKDLQGNVIRMTIAFDNATKAITGITGFRDPGCAFTDILVGLGPDRRPNSTERAVNVPAGTTAVPANRLQQLAQRGMATITEVLASQITAG